MGSECAYYEVNIPTDSFIGFIEQYVRPVTWEEARGVTLVGGRIVLPYRGRDWSRH